MSDLYEKAKPLAGKVMSFARDNLLVNMRFLDVALSALEPEAVSYTHLRAHET